MAAISRIVFLLHFWDRSSFCCWEFKHPFLSEKNLSSDEIAAFSFSSPWEVPGGRDIAVPFSFWNTCSSLCQVRGSGVPRWTLCPVGSVVFSCLSLKWTMRLQGISWVRSPVTRKHNQPWVNQVAHIHHYSQSASWWQTDSRDESRKWKQSLLGAGWDFAHLLRHHSEPNSIPLTACWYLIAGKFYISAYTSILSVVLLICLNTVEIFDVIFWLQKAYSDKQLTSDWTSRVTIAAFFPWMQCKALWRPRNAHQNEAQDVLACGREDSSRLTFTAKWKWLFIKLSQKYLLLFGTKVPNYLYASKAYCVVLICCIKFNLQERFLCISGLLTCVYSSPIQQLVFFKGFSDLYSDILSSVRHFHLCWFSTKKFSLQFMEKEQCVKVHPICKVLCYVMAKLNFV